MGEGERVHHCTENRLIRMKYIVVVKTVSGLRLTWPAKSIADAKRQIAQAKLAIVKFIGFKVYKVGERVKL
jgi:hypothetical protein